MNLKDLLFVLKRHLLLILIAAVVSGTAFFLVAQLMLTPVYSSQATLIVSTLPSDSTKAVTGTDIVLSQNLVNTYAVVLKGNTLMTQVRDELDLPVSPQSLAQQISITGVGTTAVLQMSVRDTDPQRAADIAAAILKLAPAEINRTIKAGTVEVISSPTFSTVPISPNVKLITLIGAVLGFFVMAIAVVLYNFLNDNLRSEADIRETMGYAVIGVIPDIERNERKSVHKWIKEKLGQLKTPV